MNHKLKEFIDSTVGGLAKLNSITKYPSIPTFHEMGDKGRLGEKTVDMGSGPWTVTEKVDGTNTRLILTPAGWLVGSREELLAAEDDIVQNPALGIVAAVQKTAQAVHADYIADGRWHSKGSMVVVYGETYGFKIGAGARCYTNEPTEGGFRSFDFGLFEASDLRDLAAMPVDQIALWREAGRARFGFEGATPWTQAFQPVPWIALAAELPKDIAATEKWMRGVVDACEPLAKARAMVEGVVVREKNGPRIAKMRFEDYARTLKALARSGR